MDDGRALGWRGSGNEAKEKVKITRVLGILESGVLGVVYFFPIDRKSSDAMRCEVRYESSKC
jgi:hypothetical protein